MIGFIIASLAFTSTLASFGTIQPAQYGVDDLHVDFGDLIQISSSEWYLSTDSDEEIEDWDIQLDLSGDFQFSSSSYINIADFQINIEKVTNSADVFFGFGVGNKYFTMGTDFDGTFDNGLGRRGIQIYPACGGSLAAGHVSDVLSGSSNYDDRAEHAIRSALAGGDRSNWEQMGGSRHDNGDTWPVTVEIKNNALTNEVTVKFISATQELECVYADSFDQDTDLVFGIQGDAQTGEDQFKITSVTMAEENVDICEGMCAASSGSGVSGAWDEPQAVYAPFTVMVSTKDVLIALLAILNVVVLAAYCICSRAGGVKGKYRVVVAGDSEMEEFGK